MMVQILKEYNNKDKWKDFLTIQLQPLESSSLRSPLFLSSKHLQVRSEINQLEHFFFLSPSLPQDVVLKQTVKDS